MLEATLDEVRATIREDNRPSFGKASNRGAGATWRVKEDIVCLFANITNWSEKAELHLRGMDNADLWGVAEHHMNGTRLETVASRI